MAKLKCGCELRCDGRYRKLCDRHKLDRFDVRGFELNADEHILLAQKKLDLVYMYPKNKKYRNVLLAINHLEAAYELHKTIKRS